MLKDIVFLPESQEHEIRSFLTDYEKGLNTFIFQTSGSTGPPKHLSFSKNQLIVSAKNTITFFKLHERNTFYLCLNINTVAAKMMLIRALVCGAKVVCGPVTKKIKPPETFNIDFISLVPIQLEYLLSTSNLPLKNIIFLLGGAPISRDLTEVILQKEITCYQSFGMTETLSHVALRQISNPELPYTALDGIHFESNNGKLIIHYPQLQNKPIETNDEIELVNDSQFYWKGRLDFVVNSGGTKIHPIEIEKRIHEHVGLTSIVFGIPDKILGEQLVIAILGDETQAILKKKFKFLESHQIPKKFQWVKAFHYLANEKIDRITTINECQYHEWREIL